jgi:hypothetical protein
MFVCWHTLLHEMAGYDLDLTQWSSFMQETAKRLSKRAKRAGSVPEVGNKRCEAGAKQSSGNGWGVEKKATSQDTLRQGARQRRNTQQQNQGKWSRARLDANSNSNSTNE